MLRFLRTWVIRRRNRNVGRVENKGFEFTLSTVNIATKKFRWNSDFNISFNRNKVLALANDQTVLPSDQKIPNGASLYIARVGQPIGMMYGALTDGLYQYEDFDRASDGSWILKGDRPSQSTTTNRGAVLPGYQRFKDLNNDLQITQDDMTIIGNPNPDFIGGFTNNFEFANFDLQLFFTFSYGNDILNMNRYYLEEGRQISTNQFCIICRSLDGGQSQRQAAACAFGQQHGLELRPLCGGWFLSAFA